MVQNHANHAPQIIFSLLGIAVIAIGWILNWYIGSTSSIILSIGTSILSVAVISVIWKTTFGNQPVENMFNELCESIPLLQKGVKDVYFSQASFPYNTINSEIERSRKVFILTQYFRSFAQYTDIQESFSKCLSNGGEIQIIFYGPAGDDEKLKLLRTQFDRINTVDVTEPVLEKTIGLLEEFRGKLPPKQRGRFNFKLLKENPVLVGIYGTDNNLWITTLLNSKPGASCPGFLVERQKNKDPSKDLYSIYAEEFTNIWARLPN